jgi:proteasome lid subunit RPN8/RPN11
MGAEGSMRTKLVLKKAHLEEILAQAKRCTPMEACGLLVGKKAGRNYICEQVLPTKNADESPYSFTIAPEELLAGYRYADERKMEVVGIYHSHPSDASPSGLDLKFMKWNLIAWLILSTVTWDYAAYIMEGSSVVKMCVNVV